MVCGFSCKDRKGIHLRDDVYGVDIVNDSGTSVPPGHMGYISVYEQDDPTSRCILQDRGVLNLKPCSCGQNSPKIVRFLPDGKIDSDLIELGQSLQRWSSILDCRLDKTAYGLEMEIIYFDGDNPDKNKWNLTVNTGYKKLNIKAGQTKYKTYRLYPTLQNAKIIEPQAIEDDYGTTKYYLDPKHTTIKLQANDGYTFESDGSLTYNAFELSQETLTIKATHTNTATVTLPSDIDWALQQSFTITMGAVKSEIVETTGGFTNIYKADYTNLLKFSNEVIVRITGGTGGGVQSYDVTPYINNLIMLPFNVPTGDKSTIVAGNQTFTTQLSTVDINYLTVDVGKIRVNEQYKNGFDYYQVKTRLILPYTNMIELDPKHVINQTVSIKYIVNVINGDTTINLSNDDDIFYSTQVNLASEIPFISSATKGSQYTVINQLKTAFRNSIKQAYIIIEQPTPVLNSDFYPTNEKGTLKGYTGNVKARLLNNMDINSNDLNALQNLMETGIKIK